jgi:peroxiredoxin
MKPPAWVLAETAPEKLGTAPNGFGLAVGDKAPDATLPDVTGAGRSLAALYAERPTILFFYRGGWCPFCNLQIHEYAAAKSEFDARGVGIVAISVDKPSEEAKTQAKQGAAFPMLSDSKLAAHRAYHVVHDTTSNEREALAKYGVDLGAYSGESHGNYAVPATFVIDRTGTVRFVHVDQDYKTRPSARQMLEIADKVLGAPSDRRGAENAR